LSATDDELFEFMDDSSEDGASPDTDCLCRAYNSRRSRFYMLSFIVCYCIRVVLYCR